MREDPDIIKILREEERLGKLIAQPQGSYEELEIPGEVLDHMPDKSIAIFEEEAETRGMEDNLVIETKKEKRKSGITVIGDVSWGTHLCQFYQTKEDLLDILAPYFKAGLENNEFCMWVTSEPLHVEDAKTALGKVVKGLKDYIKKGQIEILDYSEWYTKTGGFDSDQVLKGWVEKEKQALKSGFDGLRLTGNTFWLEKKDWDEFIEYEEAINSVIGKHRMIAICSYSLDKCGAAEVIDVVSNHQFALIRQSGKWNIVKSSESKIVKEISKKSKKDWEKTFNAITDWVCLLDKNHRIIRSNSAAENILGTPQPEVMGQLCCKVVHGSDKPLPGCPLETMLLSRKRESMEIQIPDSRWLKVTVDPVKDGKENVVGAVHIVSDITEQKKAEEEKEKLSKAIEITKEAINITAPDGTILYTNDAMDKLFGYRKGRLIGKNISCVNVGPRPKSIVIEVKESLKTRGFWSGEVQNKRKDGSEFTSHAIVTAHKDKNGKIMNYVCAQHDITEKKKAEEALKESKEKLKLSMKSAREGMWEWDFTTDQADFDEVCLQMLGYKPGEIQKKGEWWWTQWHPDDVTPTKKAVKDYLEGRAEKYSVEFRLKNKSGKYVWISSNGIVIRKDKSNKPLYMIGIHQDISEKKETEIAIKHSEEKIRKILESSPDSITVTDLEGNITECNEATLKLHKFSSKEELIGKSAFMFFPKGEQKRAMENLQKTLKDGSIKNLEYTLLTKDGKEFPAELSVGVINDASGKPVAFVAITKDITERKEAQEILQESEDKYRKLFELGSDALFLIEVETGRILDLNDTVLKMYGYSREEALQMKNTDFSAEPAQTRQATVEHEQQIPVRCHKKKDGTIFPTDISVAYFIWYGIEVCIAAIRDITERNKAESEIKYLKEYNESILESNPNPIMVNKGNQIEYVNNSFVSIFGKTKDDYVSKNLKEVLPSETILFFQKLLKKQDTDITKELEIGDKCFNVSSFVVKKAEEEEEEEERIGIILQDITERKQAEEELKESEENLAEAQQIAHIGSWNYNIQKDKLSWSEETYNLFYIKHEEFTGNFNGFFKCVHPDDKKLVKKSVDECIATGKVIDFEHRIIGPDGKVRILHERGKAFYDKKKNPVRLAGTAQDITKRRKSEEELEKNNILLRGILDNTHMMAVFLDKEFNFIWVNAAYAATCKHPQSFFSGKNHFDLYPGDEVKAIFQRVVDTGEPFFIQARPFQFPDQPKRGITYWDWSLVPLKDAEGAITGLVFTLAEVTDRLKAEIAVKDSEEKYRNIVETAPDAIMTMDLKGVITSCNQAALNMVGYTRDEFVGGHFSKLGVFRKRDIPILAKVFFNVLRGKQIAPYEFQFIRRDGSACWGEGRYKLQEKNGKIIGLQAIIRDITDRKNFDSALKESEEKYRTMVEVAPDGIATINLKGVITSCNDSFLKLSGYSRDEVLNKHFSKLKMTSKKELPKYIKLLASVLRGKAPKPFITQWTRKDGSTCTGEIHIGLIKKENHPIAIQLITRDITEREMAREKIEESEEKYKRLFESSPNLIAEADGKGNFLAINPLLAKSLGVPAEKLIGKNMFDVLPKEVAERRAKLGRKALKTNKIQTSEDERAGRYFYNTYVPIIRPEGTKTVQCITSDITKQRQAEEKTRKSEEKVRSFMDSATDSFSVWDSEFNLVDFNKAGWDKFYPAGVKGEELIGKNILDLEPGLKESGRYNKYLNVIKTGKPFFAQDVVAHPKFGNLHVSVKTFKVGDGLGMIVEDVTERKRAEKQIKLQNVKLKKLDRIKTDFLNVTSHELRTPMAAIKGYIQMLLKQTLGEVNKDQESALEVILRNTDRLDHLVQDILDISRLESGTMKFVPEKTDISKMIKESLQTMQYTAEMKNIKINTELGKNIPVLTIDQERIKQVITNLVDNAIKFSPSNSTVMIRAKKDKNDVLVEVQDFGRGIPKNKQKKIFERFYQVESGMDRKFGGVGLGLAISQGVVKSHGGNIWVDNSTKGKGSTFKFNLPIDSVENIEEKFKEMDVFGLENDK